MSWVLACGKHTPPFAFGIQPCLTHQSGYPFAGDASSLIVQLGMQAWAAVSAMMSLKLLSNLLCELGIFSFALTGGTLSPGVKATFRDIKHSAHDDNGEFLLVLFDKLLFHLDSREKMPTTFFKISRSCWTLSSSRGIAAVFLLSWRLVSAAWKGFFAVLSQFLAPLVNGGI
jgi:hypothetical protein